ncbi:MAG: BRO family protein [Rickettsiales bacterium]|jgi:prophage antirepressor-like protein|nr:BRO family protein [Rickettsiales bacterium]
MAQLNVYNQNLTNETLPQIFNFEGSKVRVILDKQGDPWFMANEMAKILGYRMASDATRILEPDEKGTHNLRTLGGIQKLSTVNESGLYSLIFASRKSEAKTFKKWVTSEVLPTIRKTGGYGKQVNLSDPKLLHQLVLDYTDRVIKLESKLANDQPKVDFYDDFINADGLYNLQNAARALGLNPNLFINSLKNNYLFYQGRALVPYQRYKTQGLFVVKSNVADNQAYYQTYVTPKGIEYFAKQQNYLKAS